MKNFLITWYENGIIPCSQLSEKVGKEDLRTPALIIEFPDEQAARKFQWKFQDTSCAASFKRLVPLMKQLGGIAI